MNIPCLLYTRDSELARRLPAFVGSLTDIRPVPLAADLKRDLEQAGPALVLFDIRGQGSLELLHEATAAWPASLFIVLGTPRSEPILAAGALGVYALEDLALDGPRARSLVRQALAHLQLTQEMRLLRAQVREAQNDPDTPARAAAAQPALRQALPPLRYFDNVESLVRGIMNGIADAGIVLRAGIFTFASDGNVLRLAAGTACRESTRQLAIPKDAPLVRWLEVNAQMVSRATLERVRALDQRGMLERALDAMGAELIVPLEGHRQLIGWLFLGRRSTGLPFDETDLRDIVIYAERVAMALENALLYEEAARQKIFAETLLHSLPTGIVAVAEDARICWVSDAAERLLGVRREDVLRQPAEKLGSRVAGRLRLALRDAPEAATLHEWTDPATHQYFTVRAARLKSATACFGAVAFIHDATQDRLLARKQRELDRSAFWTELAANMSHEVRNPLVTIKTFAQLLPERYSDPEFRTEFSLLMSQEVDRLNAIIEQINTFASLSPPVFKSVEIRDVVSDAIELARVRIAPDGIVFNTGLAANLRRIRGDRRALADCFAHILANAMQALEGRKDPRIEIDVRPAAATPSGNGGIEVSIRDNGRGMRPDIRENAFSPFCTTKPNGMGLGLPIAQRTVLDHDGQISIDSSERGTTVTVLLPTESQEEEAHEALARG